MQNFGILHRIGEGTFGEVFKAKSITTGKVVALKKIRIPNVEHGIPISLVREVKALQQIRNPHVIPLHEHFPHGGSVILVMECMTVDLRQIMARLGEGGRTIPPAMIKSILIMTLKGVDAVHKMNMIHRDLKPANLLLTRNGILKLADFGLVRVHDKKQDYTHEVATRWYRSPSLLFGSRSYGPKVDMWAVGCIFGEMINHMPLFPGQNDIDQLSVIFESLGTPCVSTWPRMVHLPDYSKISFPKMKPKLLSSILPNASQPALNLIRRLLVYNPADRPSASEALLDPYFVSIPAPVHHSRLKPLINATQQLAQLRNKTRPSFEFDAPFDVEGL